MARSHFQLLIDMTIFNEIVFYNINRIRKTVNPNIYQTLNTKRRNNYGKFTSSLQRKQAVWYSFLEHTVSRAPHTTAEYTDKH